MIAVLNTVLGFHDNCFCRTVQIFSGNKSSIFFLLHSFWKNSLSDTKCRLCAAYRSAFKSPRSPSSTSKDTLASGTVKEPIILLSTLYRHLRSSKTAPTFPHSLFCPTLPINHSKLRPLTRTSYETVFPDQNNPLPRLGCCSLILEFLAAVDIVLACTWLTTLYSTGALV